MPLLINYGVGIFSTCDIFRTSFLKHADQLLYSFRFTCQKEQTIRRLPLDNTAFPFPSQAKKLKSEVYMNNSLLKSLFTPCWSQDELSYNTRRQLKSFILFFCIKSNPISSLFPHSPKDSRRAVRTQVLRSALTCFLFQSASPLEVSGSILSCQAR